MSGLCRDCKWWGWDFEKDRAERDCRLFSDWPLIRKPTSEEAEPHPSAKALIAPFAGADGGTLVTMPDFGCVQWEKNQ